MKKLIATSSLAVLMAAAVLAQLAPERMDIAEFRKLHDAQKVLVVDVRDAASFANGHIPGAINVPLGQEEQAAHLRTLKAAKRPIVTYCA